MKKYNCFIISFFVFLSGSVAQNTNQYKWGPKTPILIECDQFGTAITGSKVAIPPYSYFWITNKKDDNTVIATLGLWAKIEGDGTVNISNETRFQQLNLSSSSISSLTTKGIVNNGITAMQIQSNRKYFLVPVSALGTDAIPVYETGWKSQRLTIGATTLPFKLRLHNFDFAKDLNIGTVIGVNRRIHPTKNNFVNYLFNISISVNDIDNLSARNVPADQLPAKNIASLTLGGGVVWQFGKGQVGLFYGFDFMSHSNWTKYHWVYNKMPWIGIGFGINIFQKDDLNAGPGDEISNYKKQKGRSTAPEPATKN